MALSDDQAEASSSRSSPPQATVEDALDRQDDLEDDLLATDPLSDDVANRYGQLSILPVFRILMQF